MRSVYLETIQAQQATQRILRTLIADKTVPTQDGIDALSDLQLAEPVYVAPDTASAIFDASVEVTADVTLEESDIPIQRGYVLFDEASPQLFIIDASKLGPHTRNASGLTYLVVISFTWHKSELHDCVHLWLHGCIVYPPQPSEALLDAYVKRCQLNDTRCTFSICFGDTIYYNNHLSHGVGESPSTVLSATLRSVAYALWAFMNEKRATTITEHTGDRATRKRFERETKKPAPTIRVVELRATEAGSHNPDPNAPHRAIERDYSWTVRGHTHTYRRGPGHSERFKKWTAPYVKGDPSKTLRNPTKLFAVVK